VTGRRLWVDDLREPPPGWDWAKTSREAILALTAYQYELMSLDHDLGGDDTTRPVVLFLCEHGGWPARTVVHTANPVGAEWLTGMIARYGPARTRPAPGRTG
jgi:hypothetical protein